MANTTTITGNLTREPEIRYTREGQATAQLGVAVNRRWQDRTTQEWQESTSFFDVICWRDLAENVALSLTKGMRVVVTGRLEQRTWETEEGEHRSKVEITADEVGPSLRFATADVQRVERRGAVAQPDGEGAAVGRGVSVALADRHRGLAGSHVRRGGPDGAPGDRCDRCGGDRAGSGERGAPAAPLPGAPGPPIDFLKDEVVEICGALALGGSLLRRLGLCAEAARLEELFGAVEERLAEVSCRPDPPQCRARR